MLEIDKNEIVKNLKWQHVLQLCRSYEYELRISYLDRC